MLATEDSASSLATAPDFHRPLTLRLSAHERAWLLVLDCACPHHKFVQSLWMGMKGMKAARVMMSGTLGNQDLQASNCQPWAPEACRSAKLGTENVVIECYLRPLASLGRRAGCCPVGGLSGRLATMVLSEPPTTCWQVTAWLPGLH